LRLEAEVAGRRLPVEVRGGGDASYAVTIGEHRLEVEARRSGGSGLSLLVGGRSHDVAVERTPTGFRVHLAGEVMEVRLSEAASAAMGAPTGSGPGRVIAPMPGKIVRVLVAPGREVDAGQGVVVVEAMKMENELKAVRAGTVRAVHVREGQAVDGGTLLVELE
jgi:biotin carboxyl carrier protein